MGWSPNSRVAKHVSERRLPSVNRWRWTDALFFTAVAARGGTNVPLSGTLEAADAIGRMLLDYDEVVGAITRLVAADMLEATGATFYSLTERGRAIWTEAVDDDLFAAARIVRRRLHELGASSIAQSTDLSMAEFLGAEEAYRRRAATGDAQENGLP